MLRDQEVLGLGKKREVEGSRGKKQEEEGRSRKKRVEEGRRGREEGERDTRVLVIEYVRTRADGMHYIGTPRHHRLPGIGRVASSFLHLP